MECRHLGPSAGEGVSLSLPSSVLYHHHRQLSALTRFKGIHRRYVDSLYIDELTRCRRLAKVRVSLRNGNQLPTIYKAYFIYSRHRLISPG